MHLLKDLYTIRGDLLVKKDTKITPRIVSRIREMGAKHKSATVKLKDTGIFSDFRKVFRDAKYANILKSPTVNKEICEIAGKLEIEDDLVLELNAMKSNIPYTYNHALIVAALAIRLSLVYGPGRYDKYTTARCGFTHDIGKTRIAVSILEKRKKLNAKERSMINTHTIMGYLLLCYYLKNDRTICPLANLDHHERPDGSGYPRGITKIGRYSRLISIVDILDALMTKRPYRNKAFVLRAALDYLLKQAYMKRFDINMILPLVSLARKENSDMHSIRISKETRYEIPD